MLNRIVIMGRLVRDPELRRTQSGTSVTTITVAVDRDYKSKDTEEKQTDFIDVTAWRTTAEFISKYFSKGRMIVVEGSLQSRKWTDKNGQNRVSWEVQAQNVYFGDSKKDGANNAGVVPYEDPGFDSYGAGYSGGFDEVEDDGELPF